MLIQSGTTTFHDLIDLQAKKTPSALAVISQTERLTYAELTQQANRLAHRLIEAGVTRESLVGICVERSVHMIVGILAILKSGGAYVPLDPTYPADRLAYMVEDSATRFVVAQSTTLTSLPKCDAECILLDTFDAERYSAETPSVEIAPDQLAYIIYTSGSTGRPKGVMVEHQSMASLALWTKQRFSPAQSNRVLASSSLSFDVSVFELTMALSSGGALVIVRNALDLLLEPPREPISMMITVPSPVAELVRSRAIPSSVNTIILGGEILSHTLANEIYASTGVTELINVWGVTEDTVATTEYIVPTHSQSDPPIGEAIAGRRIHLLDKNLQLVPVGTPGEICCTGIGVARGYLNRADLTSERFVANPFGDSARMYRSGDLAIEGPNGEIRFIGRNDQQVKIRGFRIELGEIETALADYPNLAQVAVIAKMISGNTSLAMYAVPRDGARFTLVDVEQFLADRLPKHMIPSSLTLIDSMPLGPTGKTDRKALQALVCERPDLPQAYVAPRDAMEQQIADLFTKLLGIEGIGIEDNFFALGGQSLLAARAIAEITEMFPQQILELEVRLGARALSSEFWQQPTIECISTALQDKPCCGAIASPVDSIQCLQEGNAEKTPIFLLHGIFNGEAFYSWNLAQALPNDQPLYAIAPHGKNGAHVPRTIEAMAADYLAKIKQVQPQGPYQLIGYCNGGLVCFEMARMLESRGEEVSRLVLIAVPGHNVRFARLERIVSSLGHIPGMSSATQNAIFVRLRGRIWRALQSLGRIPLEVASNGPAIVFDAQSKKRNDAIFLAIDTYVPKPYGGSATLIFGEEDVYAERFSPVNDWKQVVKQLHVSFVPGDHHFIEKHPEVLIKHLCVL